MNNKHSLLLLPSGILAIVILWTTVSIGMIRDHLGLIDRRPISYLGVNPHSATLFSNGLITSALLFIVFGFYIQKLFRTPRRFIIYFLIGQFGQIVVALVPYGSESHYRLVHTIAAFTLAFSLPLLIRQFNLSQYLSKSYPLYQKLLRFEQVSFVIGIGLFVLTKGLAPLGEALPTIGFHLWIIVLSVLIFQQSRSVGSEKATIK